MTEDLESGRVTFVVNVSSPSVLKKNLLISPSFRPGHRYQILQQENFASAATAYNDALEKSHNDLVIFVHQDVILPSAWISRLQEALDALENIDPHWGVLGVFGRTATGEQRGSVYSTGLGLIGSPFKSPAVVQTLDEIVLIIRKSSGLRFDERLPHFHFYGAEICLAALQKGMKSYAIPAFCIHNTQYSLVLPKEFYASYGILKNIWKKYVPVYTTCIRITKFNSHVYRRRINEFALRYLRRKTIGAYRREDSSRLLKEFENS
jgi:glycosyltransferase involved in cell wall biosynthesis